MFIFMQEKGQFPRYHNLHGGYANEPEIGNFLQPKRQQSRNNNNKNENKFNFGFSCNSKNHHSKTLTIAHQNKHKC